MYIFRTAIAMLMLSVVSARAEQEQPLANKQTAIKIMDAFNEKDLETLDDLIALNYVDHTGFKDKKEYLQSVQTFFTAFPDLKVAIDDTISEKDKVVLYFTFQGTHKGLFLGIQPTQRSVKWSGIGILRFEKGKMVERWNVSDVFSLLQQLGYTLQPPD